MSKAKATVSGGVLIAALAVGAALTAADQRNQTPIAPPVEPVEEPLDFAAYSGPGSVLVTPGGECTLKLHGTEPFVFDATRKDRGLWPEHAVEGYLDIVIDRNSLWILALTADDAGDQEVHEARLRLGDEEASWLVPAITAADDLVRLDGGDGVRDQECPGGTCECIGKCRACCPEGRYPYCRCEGPGLCTCRADEH